MNLKQIVSSMTKEMRDTLSTAVEIGRWQDGTPLSEQQKASTLQALIAWDTYYGENTDEPFKVQKGGDIIRTVKKEASKNKQSTTDARNIIQTINIDEK